MEYVQRELPYVRSYVLRSVYGMLRQEGIAFGEEAPGRVIAECRAGRNRRLPFHNGGGKSVWNRTDGFAAPPLRRDTGAESVPASAGDAGPDRPALGTSWRPIRRFTRSCTTISPRMI